MPSAYVLYLNDEVAAPAFELLRRVCQPRSRSLPHVTVRYPIRRQDLNRLAIYDSAQVGSLILSAPGSFPSFDAADPLVAPRTVYLQCESNELESLVYKPDYPDSVFHLTIYDGKPSEFSRLVAEQLRAFPWQLEIKLRPSTGLTRIPIGPTARPSDTPRPALSEDAESLLASLTQPPLSATDLGRLEDEMRLSIVHGICEYLHGGAQAGRRQAPGSPAGLEVKLLEHGHWYEQPPLWEGPDEIKRGLSMGQQVGQIKRDFARALSLFLTPPEVAQEMVDAALVAHDRKRPIDFGDPAIGNGIFFAALLQKVKGRRLRSAIGVEIDSTRALALAQRWSRQSSLRVWTGNFIKQRPDSQRSLVLANPPYLRFQKLDGSEAQQWREHLGRALNLAVDGRSDLFVYFVLFAHEWMQPGCVAGWLLPIEFMESQYGSALREYLTNHVTLERIHLFDRTTSQFENAKISSTFVLLRNTPPKSEATVQVSHGGSVTSPLVTLSIPISELRDSARWTLTAHPRRPRAPITQSELTIGDVFRVRRGIATGANAWFVIDDVRRHALAIPAKWLKPVVPPSRQLSSNIIDSDSKGNPRGVKALWLIDSDAPFEQIAEEAPAFADYLLTVERQVGSRNLLKSRRLFYRQDRISSPTFFFGYMARIDSSRLPSRFFLNNSRAVILNNYLGMYPLAALTDVLREGRLTSAELYDILVRIPASEIGRHGRHYAEGLMKLEPTELKNVRLPRNAIKLLRLDK